MRRLLYITLPLLLILILFVPTADASGICARHYVQRGENLFRISLRYGVNMYDVAALNNIPDITRIYAGQTLLIPCGGSGYHAPSQPSYTPPTYPTYDTGYSSNAYTPHYTRSGYVNCRGFQATSPGSFPNGSTTFYWNAPADYQHIARYQVRIYNALGREVGRYETLGLNTSLQADVGLGAIGPGTNFYYRVVGVTADQQICRTGTRYAQREWNGTLDPTH